MVLEELGDDRCGMVGDRDSEERITDRVSSKTTVDKHPCDRFNATQRNQIPSDEETDWRFNGKVCNRASQGSENTCFLQPFFHSAQEGSGEMESNIRFESTQSEGEEGEIQNGDCRECQRAAKSRRVGNVNRSHRCLSSYSGGTEAQEIFSICVQWDSLPVQGATDGLDFITTGVHKGDKDNTAIFTSKRSESPSISRRLVDTWEKLPAGERTHSRCWYS